jgi:hypothetical protein
MWIAVIRAGVVGGYFGGRAEGNPPVDILTGTGLLRAPGMMHQVTQNPSSKECGRFLAAIIG